MARPGTVGAPCPPIEVSLRDFEEAGYFANGNPQEGEICIRGPAVCKGYCKFSADALLLSPTND